MRNPLFLRQLRKTFVLVLVVVALLFLSCASYTEYEREEESYVDTVLEEYQDLEVVQILKTIIEKETVRSVPLIEKFREHSLIDDREVVKLTELASTTLVQKLEGAISEEEYQQALLHYENLLTLEHVFEDFDPKKIYTQIVLEAAEKKNYPVVTKYAKVLFQDYKDLFFSDKINLAIFDALGQYPDITVAQVICQDRNVRNRVQDRIAKEAQYVDFCLLETESTPVAQSLEATFVVDLNLGIAITERGPELSRVLGSGFFVTKDGYALTNYHVIQSQVDSSYEGRSDLSVRLQEDGFKSRPAKVLGYDPLLDLALLKVSSRSASPIPIRTGNRVQEGDSVLAVGSPIGLTNSLSSGIVSAKDRRILETGGVLQVDASINQGNSGGPLLDKDNNLIGVVFSKILNFENLNFAIPSNLVYKVLPALFEGEEFKHSWLGAGVVENEEGLEILYITPNSPAEKSNLFVGDIVTHINGVKTDKIIDVQQYFLDTSKGQIQKLTVLRKDKEEEIYSYTGVRDKDPFRVYLRQSALYKIFPVLIGASIKVTKFGNSPIYRIEEVYEEGYAWYIDLNPGDLVNVVQARRNKDNLILVLNILQENRGFTTDGLSLTIPLLTSNFI